MNVTSPGLNPGLSNSINNSAAQIASGKKVNSAADSPAAIALISQFSSQILGNNAAHRNVMDGVSALQVAEGGISDITDSLHQLRELGLQSGNGTLNDSDRAAIQKQAEGLLAGIQDALGNSQFNNTSLLNNSDEVTLQTGANEGQQQALPSFDLTAEFTNVGLFDIDFTTDSLSDTLDSIDQALDISDTASSAFGAAHNRLESTAASLTSATINQSSSRSQIEDTDYAAAVSEQTKQLIAREVEIALLGQANANRGQVLQLLNMPG
ncbi:MAG: flagellin [Oceanospirillaceae bacterium]|nr:flagellin [Oceanospirillaceae bacterium]